MWGELGIWKTANYQLKNKNLSFKSAAQFSATVRVFGLVNYDLHFHVKPLLF